MGTKKLKIKKKPKRINQDPTKQKTGLDGSLNQPSENRVKVSRKIKNSQSDLPASSENILELQKTIGNRAAPGHTYSMIESDSNVKNRHDRHASVAGGGVTLGTQPSRSSMSWDAWQWTADGQEYNRLRTRLEREGYRFITKVQTSSGTWESRSPESSTPANRIGWSIGSPDGYWSWATTDGVVSESQRILQLQPVDLGQSISNAGESLYTIDEPMLSQVPNHFLFTDDRGNRWAGETQADIIGARSLTPVRVGGRLVTNNIPWQVDCTVHLPRWRNLLRANNAERQEWARFMRRLRLHEQGHVDRAHQFIQTIDHADHQVTGANLQEIQENLQFLGDELQTTLQMEHDQYDEDTRHGATQGAVLRPVH